MCLNSSLGFSLVELFVVCKILILFTNKFLGLSIKETLLLLLAHAALNCAYYLLGLLLIRHIFRDLIIESLHDALMVLLLTRLGGGCIDL